MCVLVPVLVIIPRAVLKYAGAVLQLEAHYNQIILILINNYN